MKKRSLIYLFFFAAIIVSCQKADTLPNDEKVINDDSAVSLIGGFAAVVNDFSTDQVQCNVTIDSLHPHVINNFSHGVEIPSFIMKYGALYRGVSATEFGYIYPLAPIIEYTKNELTVKKIIASWSQENVHNLSDSIFRSINSIDSNFHKDLVTSDLDAYSKSTTIFVNLLNVNRYGYAIININNADINNYLTFKTNKFGDIENDSINISSQKFREDYGDAFCSSLMLGTCSLLQGQVYGVNADSVSQAEALVEAIDKIKIYLSDNTDWKELVKDSKYLKNSFYLEGSATSVYGYPASFIFNYQEHLREMDSIYQMGDFTPYSKGVRRYSDLYPNYPFVEVDFPQ